jgi:hypothetical protein
MARHSQPDIPLQRLRLIVNFLNSGGGTLLEMMEYVNKWLNNNGFPTVERRVTQYDLNKLQSGEFPHSLSSTDKSKLGGLFRYEYKDKKYQWKTDSLIPKFDDLEDDERLTLPLLFGVLKRYSSIPAMQKIMDMIEEKYDIRADENNTDEVFFIPQPRMTDENFEKRIMELTLKLIGHIQRSEQIEFHYTAVNKFDESNSQYKHFLVAPLQVKLYENYYYLSGIDLINNRIMNFRVDQIKKLRVDAFTDEETGEIVHFSRSELIHEFAFNDHYKHVLGVWTHHTTDELHRITIEFKDWAASYARHLSFHPSQRTVGIDAAKNTLTITLDLLLLPEKSPQTKLIDRSPELHFLLGRFREFANIIKIKKI